MAEWSEVEKTIKEADLEDDTDERAVAAVGALVMAGFDVHYYKHVNVIKIDYESCDYYIKIPIYKKYGILITNKKIIASYGHNITIKLTFNHIATYEFIGEHRCVYVGNTIYLKSRTKEKYVGQMNGNLYLNFFNSWTELRDPDNRALLLDNDFNPVKEIEVNIINEGFKYVLNFNQHDIDTAPSLKFTIINTKYIVSGAFMPSLRDDLLRFKDLNGNLYAFLDGGVELLTLAGESETVPVHWLSDYLLRADGGLYDGLEINSVDLQRISAFLNEEGVYVDEDGNVTDMPVRVVYRYGDIIFGLDDEYIIIELTARKPNSGSRTKSAR